MKYKWLVPGDINAFFALFLDNVINLVILAGILIYGFGMPEDFIYEKMIPGTALGVMFGDLVYTWMAIRLAKKTGNTEVTAMPLGLDTPSTIGVAFAVIGPAFNAKMGMLLSGGMAAAAAQSGAAMFAWQIGMATMIYMGLVKTITSFFGNLVQKIVPVAGLLGSLAGIGLVWLAAHHLLDVYRIPFVGLISMCVIAFTMMAYFDFPFKLPGAAAAVGLGVIVYYILGWIGFLEATGTPFKVPSRKGIAFMPPLFQSSSIAVLPEAAAYLAVAIPFGFLTIIGGINVTQGARILGDKYNTLGILITEAGATLLAGLFGGVSQSTPYIGHGAYKAMGARAGYTLFTGLAIGLGGSLGLIGFLVNLIPKGAVAPILIFVGFEITTMAFRVAPKRHAMAVVFAIIPSVLDHGYRMIQSTYGPVQKAFGDIRLALAPLARDSGQIVLSVHSIMQNAMPPTWTDDFLFFGALANGYILTAMIWGAAVAFLIDRQVYRMAIAMAFAAVFTLCGMIHSVMPDGGVYLPWWLADAAEKGLIARRAVTLPYELAAGYILVAIMVLAMYHFGPAHLGKGPSTRHEEEAESHF